LHRPGQPYDFLGRVAALANMQRTAAVKVLEGRAQGKGLLM